MNLEAQIKTLEGDLEELKGFLNVCKRDGVKRILEGEVNKLSERKAKLEKDLQIFSGQKETDTSHSLTGNISYKTVTNYAWDQSNEYVKVYVELDGSDLPLEETDIIVSVPSKRSVILIFGKKKLSLSQLHSDISKEGTHFKLKKNRITLFMKKAKESHWNSIKDSTDSWKKSLEEDKDDLTDDPNAGLMKMMKKMYDEGDDEMKRTIAKSWYESRNKDPSAELGGLGGGF